MSLDFLLKVRNVFVLGFGSALVKAVGYTACIVTVYSQIVTILSVWTVTIILYLKFILIDIWPKTSIYQKKIYFSLLINTQNKRTNALDLFCCCLFLPSLVSFFGLGGNWELSLKYT